MSNTMVVNAIQARYPRLGRFAFRATRRIATTLIAHAGFHSNDSRYTLDRIAAVRARLARGETALLAGLDLAGATHACMALVALTRTDAKLVFEGAFDDLPAALQARGRTAADIDAWLTTRDYPDLLGLLVRAGVETFPPTLAVPRVIDAFGFGPRHLPAIAAAPRALARRLELPHRLDCIMIPQDETMVDLPWEELPASDDPATPVSAALRFAQMCGVPRTESR